MTTLTPDGQLRENAADHAAAAVHALAHMSTSAHRDPTGMAIGSAAMIVAHVAEHGVEATALGLTVELEPLTAQFVGCKCDEDVVDADVIELDQQARETLTAAMLNGGQVTIRHAGGAGQFRVVAIAQDHAKVRQLRDGRGPLPTRTLHYEDIDEAGFGHVDTTADLTPATVMGHTEYRESDRQLAQDLSSTLGNLDHVARLTDGDGFTSRGTCRAIESAAEAIRCLLHDMRQAAEDESEKPAGPAFAVGDIVECVGDWADRGNRDGIGTIEDIIPRTSMPYSVHLDNADGIRLHYGADQLTRLAPAPVPYAPYPF